KMRKMAEENDDIILEETDEEGNTGDAVKKLREKLKIAVAEKQQYLDGWQRAKADFVNYKKREAEERERFIKFGNESLLLDIIPTLDNFDLAFGNKEAWEKADKNWRAGIEYIYSELVKTLEK